MMEARHRFYNFEDSRARIDEILNNSDSEYQDRTDIPNREQLTYKNGFYVKCSALFVDIRSSSKIYDNHTRPVQAKIFKTYISELIAVMMSNPKIHEIYVEGDCVWAIFNTPLRTDIDEVFEISARCSSLIDTLNIKYRKKGYSKITVGIGMSYKQSLYIKAGYKGSGINEIVWLGNLVSEAAKLCSYGNSSSSDQETMVSSVFYGNLSQRNQDLLSLNYSRNCYHGNIINREMNQWVIANDK